METNPKISDAENTKNNFRHFFSVKTVLLLLMAVVLVRMIYWNIGYKETQASDLTLENILQAINSERTLRNLPELTSDSRLSSAAQSKAQDMQARHYFSHTDPEGNYIWPKIVSAGYTPYLQLGENLAIEFYNTESLVSAWMNSPTHRANVLNEGFKDQGMGMEFGNSSEGQYHSAIVNTFGSLAGKKVVAPKPVATEVPVTTTTTTPKPTTAPTEPAKTTPKPVTNPAPPVKPIENQATETPSVVHQASTTSYPPSFPLVTIEQKPNFTTPEKSHVASGTPNTKQNTQTTGSTPSIGPLETDSSDTNNRNMKRYLSLALAVLLILFVVSDIKDTLDNKLKGLDKKINNLILLVLAVIVIAFVYWL